jgi:hypothetical protein
MSILKLTEPGSSLTFEVADLEIVKGDLGEQVKFETKSGDILYVPSASVTRQLDRVGVAEIDDLKGREVHFSRSEQLGKNGKPFWNLDKAKASDTRTNGTPTTNGTPRSKAPVASAFEPESFGRLPGDEVETGAAPIASKGTDRLGALRTTHARCFREVIENYVPVAAKAGLEISLEGASALTFQLYKMETDLR